MGNNYKLNTIPLLLLIVSLIYIPRVTESRTKIYPINYGQNRTVFSGSKNSNICKSTVVSQGYACEEHQVKSNDGYILGMQRIPIGRSGQKADKPPVLLQHGIFSDATTWMFNSPDESLAFILADQGFDVWLANTRGTESSQSHSSRVPTNPDFWDWSWDELAADDLPAFVQYVYTQTGQQLHYVGHSLGTLMALGAFSSPGNSHLRSMMRSAALLSPIAYLSLIPSPLTQAGAKLFLAEDLYWLGLREFVPQGLGFSQLLQKLCDLPGIDCSNLLNSFTGPNCCINKSKVSTLAEPTATKNIIHLAQMIRTGTIQKYDYGDENMKYYGQQDPPKYDMKMIPNNFPLFLSYGGEDRLSDPDDVKNLLSDLKDHENDKLVVQFVENYAHLDFVRGVNANKVVYEPLIAFFGLH